MMKVKKQVLEKALRELFLLIKKVAKENGSLYVKEVIKGYSDKGIAYFRSNPNVFRNVFGVEVYEVSNGTGRAVFSGVVTIPKSKKLYYEKLKELLEKYYTTLANVLEIGSISITKKGIYFYETDSNGKVKDIVYFMEISSNK